jgi:hypothetical protein
VRRDLIPFEARSGRRLDDPAVSHAAYLESCRLDPYHWAPGMTDMTVVQLHAMFDAIVPASSGRLLYERLGRPERWQYPAGHVGLLFMLHWHAGAIADWIDDAMDERP